MSIVISIARLVGYLLIMAGILIVGWNEPLRYRFMSRADTLAYEASLRPPPPAVVKVAATPRNAWIYDPERHTKLDDRSYNHHRTIFIPPYGYPYSTPVPLGR